jgi:AcrR family transcriptional regulator
MSRPATIDNERILRAAREVFLRRGVTGSTAEVARRANVSHGSIFNRFKTKAELFHACMTAPLGEEEWLKVFDFDAARDFRSQLHEIAEQMLEQMRRMMPMMMMSWSDRAHKRSMAQRMREDGPFENLVQRFEKLLEQHRAHKHIAKCNARGVVLGFLGTLHLYTLVELLFAGVGRPAPPVDEYLSDFIDTLWSGLAPKRSAARRTKTKRSARAKDSK